jgi:hypothetical protein
MLVAGGAPEGWYASLCPKTCGLCTDPTLSPPLSNDNNNDDNQSDEFDGPNSAWFGSCGQELCQPKSLAHGGMELPTTGRFIENNFVSDLGCYYNLYNGTQRESCLQGTWFVVLGGSNAELFMRWILQSMAAEPLREEQVLFSGFDSHNVFDFVFEDGTVSYTNLESFHSYYETDFASKRAEIATILAKAPEWSSGKMRLTHIKGQYWDNAYDSAAVIVQDVGWATAKIAIYVQVYVASSSCRRLTFV